MEISLLDFSSFIEIITVANFTFAFTDIIRLSIVYTVVRVPQKLNDKLFQVLGKALEHIDVIGVEVAENFGEGADILQSLPEQKQRELDEKCESYLNAEHVWCFAMGFYGLLVLLVGGFSNDFDRASVFTALSWTNLLSVLGLVFLWVRSKSASDGFRARSFTEIAKIWAAVALIVFLMLRFGTIPAFIHLASFEDWTIAWTLTMLSFPFVRYFFVRYARTSSLNSAVKSAWTTEIDRIQQISEAAQKIGHAKAKSKKRKGKS